MEQSLDLQIAALIFLGGTKNLVSEKEHGDVERMTEDEGIECDPSNPHTMLNANKPGFFPIRTPLNLPKMVRQ